MSVRGHQEQGDRAEAQVVTTATDIRTQGTLLQHHKNTLRFGKRIVAVKSLALTGVLMITARHSAAHAGSLMLNGTEPLLLSDIPPAFVLPSQVKTPAVQPVQNVGR